MRSHDAGCTACAGGSIPCKGGGNKHCWRRDPKPAHIAFILDSYGGARTVVGTRKSIAANVRGDELVRVVPGLIVHEPIAWNDIPIVIERARIEFERWLEMRPNLTAEEANSVTLYRLRQLEQPRGSLNIEAIVDT